MGEQQQEIVHHHEHEEEAETLGLFSGEQEDLSTVDPPDFSVLRLSDHHRRHHRNRHSPCSSCGCSGHSHTRRKRPPIPENSNAAPSTAKKLFLETPNSNLRRTVSGPGVPSPGTASNCCNSGALPPLPPSLHLRRCTSDPIPYPPPDSPLSKRSKMLSSWRKFNEWMEQEFIGVDPKTQTALNPNLSSDTTTIVVPTEAEEDDTNYTNNDNAVTTTTDKDDSTAEFEESLSVEKDGDRLNIHFKCHCGNGYQFLLADGNCFYKLI